MLQSSPRVASDCRAAQRTASPSSTMWVHENAMWSGGTGKSHAGSAARPPVCPMGTRHPRGWSSSRIPGAPGCHAKTPNRSGHTIASASGFRRWNQPDQLTVSRSAPSATCSIATGTPARTSSSASPAARRRPFMIRRATPLRARCIKPGSSPEISNSGCPRRCPRPIVYANAGPGSSWSASACSWCIGSLQSAFAATKIATPAGSLPDAHRLLAPLCLNKVV